ncbi:hypothetical protein SADUNF_Sadunf16G0048200 [Salix dunnii]|uniref:TypA/BipA C-terminal domain-containing protein n=1 Tax=Salix dunnii TaxID=1413687 RepID=A0A835J534_9ROSI|nr:hypothetical protein SADUNF_Sadunf16G0048200 [Salix dunnii]
MFIGSGTEAYKVFLDTSLDYNLDDSIEYVREDELVEVPPSRIQMCKNPKLAKKRQESNALVKGKH